MTEVLITLLMRIIQILGLACTLFITLTLLASKQWDWLMDKYPFTKVPIFVILFGFIVRLWFLGYTDFTDIANCIGGLFDVEPITKFKQ